MGLRLRGGLFKGREIQTLKSDKTRPTSDKIREAVFNMWQSSVEGARFLDLFAGTGAMGIEAISRGASFAIFTEVDKHAFQCLKKNIESLAILPQSALFFGNAYKLLSKLPAPFDLIYIDPPYATPPSDYIALLKFFDDREKCRPGARLIIEESCHLSEALTKESLTWLRYDEERRYGSSYLQCFSCPE